MKYTIINSRVLPAEISSTYGLELNELMNKYKNLKLNEVVSN
jgi:hypothetical protein